MKRLLHAYELNILLDERTRFSSSSVYYEQLVIPLHDVFKGQTITSEFKSYIEQILKQYIKCHPILYSYVDIDIDIDTDTDIQDSNIMIEMADLSMFQIQYISCDTFLDLIEYIYQYKQRTSINIYNPCTPSTQFMFFYTADCETTWICLNIHHLFVDGYSYQFILLRDLYALCKGTQMACLADYTVLTSLTDHSYELHSDWIDSLCNESLDWSYIPTDYDCLRRTEKGRVCYLSCNETICKRLKILQTRHRLSLFHLQQILYLILMNNMYRCSSYVFGVPQNIRDFFPNTDLLIGCFINTLPVKYIISNESSFEDVVNFTRSLYKTFSSYSTTPLSRIIEYVQSTYHVNPSIQILNNYGFSSLLEHLSFINDSRSIQTHPSYLESAIFDVSFTLYKHRQHSSYLFEMKYASELFEDVTFTQMARRLECLLLQLSEEPLLSIGEISLLLPEEVSILKEINTTYVPFDRPKLMHDHIFQQVYLNPDKEAIILDDTIITYRSLWIQATYLSKQLRSRFDLSSRDPIRGQVIVFYIDRSIQLVIGMLAILLCDCIYCPVLAGTPMPRVRDIIQNTDCPLVLYSSQISYLELDLKNVSYVDIDTINIHTAEESHAFEIQTDYKNTIGYIAHTSGSTGIPKGAEISHDSCHNWLRWLQQYSFFQTGTRYLQFARCSFDPHIREILLTLMNGSTIVLLHHDKVHQLDYVIKTIQTHHTEVVWFTPSYFLALSDLSIEYQLQNAFQNVKAFLFSGEPLKGIHVNRARQLSLSALVVNMFGPVELTCEASMKIIPQSAQINDTDLISIGSLVSNSVCKIITKGRPSFLHEQGELYISGDNVMKRYVNNLDATQRVLKLQDGKVWYKTGDLVYYAQDKELHYISRFDHQVKIRGQRLDLQDIETLMKTHPQCKDTYILFDKPTERLIGCILVNCIGQVDWKHWASSYLSEWMIPSAFIELTKWPLTKNGKIDRLSLLQQPYSQRQEVVRFQENEEHPQGDFELFLCETLSDLIRQSVSPLTPLSHLVINSIARIQFEFKILKLYSFSIQLSSYLTLRDIANRSHLKENISPILLSDCTLGKASPSQQSIYLHEKFFFFPGSGVYNINFNFRLDSSLCQTLTCQDLTKMYRKIVEKYPIFRTRFFWKNGLCQEILNLEDILEEVYSVESITYSHFLRSFYYNKPLLRFYLSSTHLLVQLHHIIYDHGCDQILLDILTACLESRSLPEESCRYIDYSQTLFNQSIIDDGAVSFMKQLLEEKYAFTEIIPSKSYSLRKGRGTCIPWDFTNRMSQWIYTFATRYQTTVHNIVLILFSRFLHEHYTNQTFYVGGNYYNRTHPDTFRTLGYFMNFITYKSEYVMEETIDETITRQLHHIQEVQRYGHLCIHDYHSLKPRSKRLPFSSIIFTEVPYNPLSTIDTSRGSLSLEPSFPTKLYNDQYSLSVYPLINYLFVNLKEKSISGMIEFDIECYDSEVIHTLEKLWIKWIENKNQN